jgi:hypothetical protein
MRQELLDTGLVRRIGVSNLLPRELDRVLAVAKARLSTRLRAEEGLTADRCRRLSTRWRCTRSCRATSCCVRVP